MQGNLTELVERVEKASGADNALDVEVEVALFKPGAAWKAIRPNNAGSKVIYTDAAGNEVTCWPQDWTMAHGRASTIAALKARGGE